MKEKTLSTTRNKSPLSLYYQVILFNYFIIFNNLYWYYFLTGGSTWGVHDWTIKQHAN